MTVNHEIQFDGKKIKNSQKFRWEDPFLLDTDLPEDLRLIQKTAKDYAQNKLNDVDSIKFYNPTYNAGPIITYNFENVNSYDYTKLLDTMNIAIRSGHHCAQPLHKCLNISSSNRMSLSFYNTIEEIDSFVNATNKALNILL